MELFKIFDSTKKNELLICPLNHPNIIYNWQKIKIEIDEGTFNVSSIGRIDKNDLIEIKEFQGVEIGFFDRNNNFVSPILFHKLNLTKKEYKLLWDATINFFNSDKSKIESNKLNKKLIDIIKLLKEEGTLYMSFMKYSYTKKFVGFEDYDLTKNETDTILKWIKKEGENVLIDYPYLKPILNVLMN